MRSHMTGIWVLVFLLGGCSFPPAEVKVAPVTFSHPDEWVSNGGFAALADRRIFATMAFQPFYDLLPAYEQSGQPFDRYLPTLLERLPEYSID